MGQISRQNKRVSPPVMRVYNVASLRQVLLSLVWPTRPKHVPSGPWLQSNATAITYTPIREVARVAGEPAREGKKGNKLTTTVVSVPSG
jgi:hypothetical protein